MTKLVMDVDTGIDDAWALAYLAASPDAELLGVACTAGNVDAHQVAINSLAVLELGGRTDVEVCVGAEVPLAQPLVTTPETHGPQGIGWAELPTPSRPVSSRHATDLWSQVAREHPGEVVGLVTGPLTNLAAAIRRDPELPGLLRRVVVMGGVFHHPGNTTPTTEWNMSVDPEAAHEVFAAFSGTSGAPRLVVCPLDLTERIALTPEHLARLAEAAGSSPVERPDPHDPDGTRSTASNPVVRHLVDATRFYLEFHRDHGQGWIAHLHDPFAAAVALDPDVASLRSATVDVELAGTLTRGTTVADWSGMWGRDANASIAVDTDPEAFFDDLIARVGRLAATVPG